MIKRPVPGRVTVSFRAFCQAESFAGLVARPLECVLDPMAACVAEARKIGLLSRLCHTAAVHALYRHGRRSHDTRKCSILWGFCVAGGPGFEPRLTESESNHRR